MEKFRKFALVSLLALAACGTYSTSSTNPATGAPDSTALAAKNPADILVTETDLHNRKYTSLGDISVTVRKTTIFDSDPTKEKINDALRERAAEMGADAVILVRYGTVGIDLMSWGSMEGNGRAVVFNDK